MPVKVQILVKKTPLHEKMNLLKLSEQMDIDLQEITKVHNIQEASRTSSKNKI